MTGTGRAGLIKATVPCSSPSVSLVRQEGAAPEDDPAARASTAQGFPCIALGAGLAGA